MRKKTVQFKGIVRVSPEHVTQEGSCEELINLRHEAGALKVVGGKSALLTDKPYHKIITHATSRYTNLIVVSGNEVRWIDRYTGANIQTIATCDSSDIQLSILSNMLIINCMDSISMVVYLFKNSTYSLLFSKFPDAVVVKQYEPAETIERGSSEVFNTYPETFTEIKLKDLKTSLIAAIQQCRNVSEDYGEGYILLSASYGLYDGSETKMSPPILVELGSYVQYPFKEQGSTSGKQSFTCYITTEKLSAVLTLPANILEYKDLITSVNIYSTRLISHYKLDPAMVSIAYKSSDAFQVYAEGTAVARSGFNTNLFESELFYRQRTIDIKSATISCDLKLGDDVTNGATMTVDSSGWMSTVGKSFIFNNRQHLFAIKRVLRVEGGIFSNMAVNGSTTIPDPVTPDPVTRIERGYSAYSNVSKTDCWSKYTGQSIGTIWYDNNDGLWYTSETGSQQPDPGWYLLTYGASADLSEYAAIRINEIGTATYLSLSGYDNTTDYNAKSLSIYVTSNVSWVVSANVSWITLQTQAGMESGTINFSVSNNANADNRVGTITVEGGGMVRTVELTQTSQAFITIDKATASVDYNENVVNVNVTSNVDWIATSSEEFVTFLVDSGTSNAASGSGNGLVKCVVAVNGPTQRTATVSITGGGITRTLVITQAAEEVLTLDKESESMDYGADDFSIVVTSNTAWTASTTSAWIIIANQSGTGNGVINWSVAENASLDQRQGTINISSSQISRTFNVVQAGIPTVNASVVNISLVSDLQNGGIIFSAIYKAANDKMATDTGLYYQLGAAGTPVKVIFGNTIAAGNSITKSNLFITTDSENMVAGESIYVAPYITDSAGQHVFDYVPVQIIPYELPLKYNVSSDASIDLVRASTINSSLWFSKFLVNQGDRAYQILNPEATPDAISDFENAEAGTYVTADMEDANGVIYVKYYRVTINTSGVSVISTIGSFVPLFETVEGFSLSDSYFSAGVYVAGEIPSSLIEARGVAHEIAKNAIWKELTMTVRKNSNRATNKDKWFVNANYNDLATGTFVVEDPNDNTKYSFKTYNQGVVMFEESNISKTGTTLTESLTLDKYSENMDYGADAFSIFVTSNTDWEAGSNKTWLIVETASQFGTGNRYINWSVTENTSTEAREAIIIVSTATGTVVRIYNVHQEGRV